LKGLETIGGGLGGGVTFLTAWSFVEWSIGSINSKNSKGLFEKHLQQLQAFIKMPDCSFFKIQ
jgi:hypothetical protein